MACERGRRRRASLARRGPAQACAQPVHTHVHDAADGILRDLRPAPSGLPSGPDPARCRWYSRRSGRAGGLSSIVPPSFPPPRGGARLPVPDVPGRTWSRIQHELRQRVPADMYEIWLAPLRPVELDGRQMVVEAPRELRGWVAERYARTLQASAVAVLGEGAVVRVRAGD